MDNNNDNEGVDNDNNEGLKTVKPLAFVCFFLHFLLYFAFTNYKYKTMVMTTMTWGSRHVEPQVLCNTNLLYFTGNLHYDGTMTTTTTTLWMMTTTTMTTMMTTTWLTNTTRREDDNDDEGSRQVEPQLYVSLSFLLYFTMLIYLQLTAIYATTMDNKDDEGRGDSSTSAGLEMCQSRACTITCTPWGALDCQAPGIC